MSAACKQLYLECIMLLPLSINLNDNLLMKSKKLWRQILIIVCTSSTSSSLRILKAKASTLRQETDQGQLRLQPVLLINNGLYQYHGIQFGGGTTEQTMGGGLKCILCWTSQPKRKLFWWIMKSLTVLVAFKHTHARADLPRRIR